MSDELAFNSKMDLWILIVVLSAVAACVWGLAAYWAELLARGWLVTGLVAVPLAIGILLPLWLIVSLRYFLSPDTLRVRCGPFQWRISIRQITSVGPTQNPLASPAMSLDRLRIEYGPGQALAISPDPRDEFLRQLEYRRRQAA
jgi:Bacterial PH domain